MEKKYSAMLIESSTNEAKIYVRTFKLIHEDA